MKNKELLPCPFCGGEAVLTHGTFNDKITKAICERCLASTRMFHTPYEAITAWNTRTNTIPVGNGENYEVTHNEKR